jgi:hypothetical protein
VNGGADSGDGGRGGPEEASGRSRRRLERLARLATEGRGLEGIGSRSVWEAAAEEPGRAKPESAMVWFIVSPSALKAQFIVVVVKEGGGGW